MNSDPKNSARPCGCDPGAHWICKQHAEEKYPMKGPGDIHHLFPDSAAGRKECPIATGVLGYFPQAIAAVARVSFIGNQQHNPGEPLRWDRTKSVDEADALIRHFLERGTLDSDGLRHSAKVAWRALALLEKEIENESRLSETR